MPQSVTVRPDGTLEFIYADKLRPLMELGDTKIRRASHVEPTSDGKWEADLSPENGPILGPFETRQEALDAEVDWLKENVLSQSTAD